MESKPKQSTLADVARAAKVAKSTASLAFSAPNRLAPSTLKRVRQAALDLGFRPNPLAQSLKSQHSPMIGLLISDMNNPLNAMVLTRAQHAASDINCLLLTATSEGSPEREIAILEQFSRLNIKGVILTSVGRTQEHADRLNAMGLEIVTLDLRLPKLSAHHVGLDNIAATTIITNYLIEHGHSRIAYISGDRGLYTADRRLEGFRTTMKAAGLTVPHNYIAHADFAGKRALEYAKELLQLPERPTAIVAANNFICASIIQAVRTLGLHCPDDISIVSVDTMPWANIITPSITCVEQPLSDMANLATRWIAEAHGKFRDPDALWRKEEFPPRFVVGDSVKSLRPITS